MMRENWTCSDPACSALNSWVQKYCEACGTVRRAGSSVVEDGTPSYSCWTCDACGIRSPGMTRILEPDGPGGRLRGLCSGCHTELRLKPNRSSPDDVCLNPECQGKPRHHVRDHIAEFRRLVAVIERRMEDFKG